MKRLTWRKIETNEIKENSLWAQVDESKYASQSFCSKLENEFTICTNKISAKTIQHPVDDKLFYFLDAKTAQNLAIMMGFLKVSPEQISKWILECDETNLTITSLEQILRCFSNTTAISEIKSILEGHNDLQNPEKLLFSLCEIPMLPQRLKCLIFKKQFSELHDECKTSIQKSIRACRKIRRSSEFKTIIEILLTSGNYINSTFKSYDCVYGFKFDFLPKVISTKTALNDRSLLHIILDHINCHDKSAIDAIIQHQKICESASRVESSEISKIIGDIRNGVECVKQFLNDSNPDDQFHIVLKIFLSESESKLDQLIDLQCSMQNEHVQLAEYLSFDVKQINEFFANLHEFICHVKQCKSEIDASKEANEKRRVRQHTSQTIAKKREANSKRRQKVQPYNQPVVKDEEENVMDKLEFRKLKKSVYNTIIESIVYKDSQDNV
ncbi:hypothetical protein GJ496_004391 [Pomphorhynchus laevis]|nr:hypothetical protein GJ496_004391 [Pomphorhynchus laevis]